MSQQLVDAITEMREEDALRITSELLEGGTSPLDILEDCRQAMGVVGEHFEKGEAFIPELMLAGEMLTQISDILKPVLEEGAEEVEKLGKIVIGTVEGDIHDIAKDIVAFMLEINGFEVTDLGVDVPPAKFVEVTKELDASIVALSGFLTLAYDPMKATVTALKEAGLDDVRVMIGGGQIDDHIRQYTGADAWGRDAMVAVKIAKQWIGA
jgi:methanogenic corrinoid protein MtbC1